MEDDDVYAEFEVSAVEKVMTSFGDAPLCWKEGREYRHVGWLQVPGRNCRFWLYARGEDTVLAVRRDDTCEGCIVTAREEARLRHYELVDLRASSAHLGRESCEDSTAPGEPSRPSTEPPCKSGLEPGGVTDARPVRLCSIPPGSGTTSVYHGGSTRRLERPRAHGWTTPIVTRAADVR